MSRNMANRTPAIPLAAAALDYTENMALWSALAAWPGAVPGWGGLVSPVKHLTLIAALILSARSVGRA